MKGRAVDGKNVGSVEKTLPDGTVQILEYGAEGEVVNISGSSQNATFIGRDFVRNN